MNHAVPHLLRYDKNAAGIQNPDGKDILSITDKNIHLQSSGYAREIAVSSGFYKGCSLNCNCQLNSIDNKPFNATKRLTTLSSFLHVLFISLSDIHLSAK